MKLCCRRQSGRRARDQRDEDRDRERRQRHPVRMEPAGPGQIGDAETVQELDRRVSPEGDETPEDERVRQSGERPLLDHCALQQNFPQKPPDAWADRLP